MLPLFRCVQSLHIQLYTSNAPCPVSTLLPIGVFLRGLKVEGCLLSLQSTILLCTFPRSPKAFGCPNFGSTHTSNCRESCPPYCKHMLLVRHNGVLQRSNFRSKLQSLQSQLTVKLMLSKRESVHTSVSLVFKKLTG